RPVELSAATASGLCRRAAAGLCRRPRADLAADHADPAGLLDPARLLRPSVQLLLSGRLLRRRAVFPVFLAPGLFLRRLRLLLTGQSGHGLVVEAALA